MSSSQGRQMLGAFYPVAALLILSPLLDVAGAVWPIRAGEVSWRFGTMGLITNGLVTPILGLALIQLIGTFAEHRGVVRFVAIIELVLGVLVLIGLALFVLDYLQLRPTVAPNAQAAYDLAAVKAMFIALLETIVLGWVGRAGLKFGPRGSGRGGSRDRSESLMVGMGPDQL